MIWKFMNGSNEEGIGISLDLVFEQPEFVLKYMY